MAWLILPAGLTAAVYRAAGHFAARYPETMAGYDTMSAERRRHADIRAAGRCVARYRRAAGCVSLAGAEAPIPGLPEVWSLRIFGASAAVPPGASAEQNDDVAGIRSSPDHILSGSGSHNRADFHSFRHIIGMVNLLHQPRRQTDLVAVGRVTAGRATHQLLLG